MPRPPLYITVQKDIGTTPARVNRQRGELQLNAKNFFDLPATVQDFIIEHEKGHYNLNTSNEVAADNYAFNHTVGKYPQSIKNSIRSLERFLQPESNAGHQQRIKAAYKRAALYDYHVNGNTKVLPTLKELEDINYEHFEGEQKKSFLWFGLGVILLLSIVTFFILRKK